MLGVNKSGLAVATNHSKGTGAKVPRRQLQVTVKKKRTTGRRKHSLFLTQEVDPPSMTETWTYLDHFYWKHPLKSAEADVLLADRSGHARIQAYEMLELQTAEEDEALSNAAFILACLRRAKYEVNTGIPRTPEDWTYGEPWLTVPAKELRIMAD